jgi:hypothetical protein
MRNLIYFTFLLIVISSGCNTCPPSDEGSTYNVNSNYLPYIIPYTDTSKVRFLKNRKDTITFVSQGLHSTFIKEGIANGNCAGTNHLQEVSLIMNSYENDFFEIAYSEGKSSAYGVDIKINNSFFESYSKARFTSYYPLPILSYTVNNIKYDSIKILLNKYNNDTVIFKPKIGILKINTDNIYEIIK